jgi:hypothetical protein
MEVRFLERLEVVSPRDAENTAGKAGKDVEKMWKRCGKHQRSTILESLFTLFPFFDIFWELPERGNSSMKERNVHIIHGICGADKNTQL